MSFYSNELTGLPASSGISIFPSNQNLILPPTNISYPPVIFLIYLFQDQVWVEVQIQVQVQVLLW
jgi:hypothetical protein